MFSRLVASHPVRAWKHYGAHRGNLLAGGVTYVALFSVVSTLVVGFTVLGTVLGRRGELGDRVIASVDEQLPGLLDVGADGGLLAPEDLFRTDVVSVAHLGRRPSAYQQSALQWLYPTCAAEGCNALTFLEFDHRVDWAKTHLTVFDLLDRLCHHHHDLKTRNGWGLVDGRGKRAFVPPDDPRHPRHAERHAAA